MPFVVAIVNAITAVSKGVVGAVAFAVVLVLGAAEPPSFLEHFVVFMSPLAMILPSSRIFRAWPPLASSAGFAGVVQLLLYPCWGYRDHSIHSAQRGGPDRRRRVPLVLTMGTPLFARKAIAPAAMAWRVSKC